MELCAVCKRYNRMMHAAAYFPRGIRLNISFAQKQTGSQRDRPPVDCGDGRRCKDTNIFRRWFIFLWENKQWVVLLRWTVLSKERWQTAELEQKRSESFSLLRGRGGEARGSGLTGGIDSNTSQLELFYCMLIGNRNAEMCYVLWCFFCARRIPRLWWHVSVLFYWFLQRCRTDCLNTSSERKSDSFFRWIQSDNINKH